MASRNLVEKTSNVSFAMNQEPELCYVLPNLSSHSENRLVSSSETDGRVRSKAAYKSETLTGGDFNSPLFLMRWISWGVLSNSNRRIPIIDASRHTRWMSAPEYLVVGAK